MLFLSFHFPARQYHATPWGYHVNEGLVEWPPSPWRILRALLATGYTKLGWSEVPGEMRSLIDALAETEPVYRLPRATQSHTRHYMPVKGWKKGVPATSLVIDAFVRPEGPLGIEWARDVNAAQQEILSRLLDRITYLGRAESRVTASLISDPAKLPTGFRVSTQKEAPDDQPVRLLAPVSRMEYASWRNTVTEAPSDLLAALQVETSWLQENKWSAPPGSRELVYWFPAKAMSSVVSRTTLRVATTLDADTALFSLATDRKRDVLPLMERALPVMELFRRALLARIGDEQLQGRCPELTGKDERGLALRNPGHNHAHFIPLSLEARNRGRIDHILVYAPMGFGPVAQRALRAIRKTWAKDISEISVTLVGLGSKQSFVEVGGVRILELATSTTWKSRTPFIFPRHLKSHGTNSVAGQIRAELDGRALPSLASPPAVTLPTGGDSSGNNDPHRFRHFVRRRRSVQAAQPTPGVFHVVLTFERAVSGPLCIGWGSHFGLGLFVPWKSP